MRVVSLLLVFFKQKTAYEMRISDWSSDVRSSDLNHQYKPPSRLEPHPHRHQQSNNVIVTNILILIAIINTNSSSPSSPTKSIQDLCSFSVNFQIGRASCRERVCQ